MADAPPPNDGSPAAPDSLCHRCQAHRLIQTKTSTFVLCTALPVKYPRQPVVACAAFVAQVGVVVAPRRPP